MVNLEVTSKKYNDNDVLEVKGDKLSVKFTVNNIQALTDEQLDNLKVGDVVQKETENQKHCYIVTYKEEKHGICLSYFACGYLETISYDYTNGHWVFNSKDVYEGATKSELALKANISGQAFTGAISAPSIIEDMEGYSFTEVEDNGWTKNITYAGVVKNGNKLTFVCCGVLTKTDNDATQYPIMGKFIIPSDIASKLFPISGTIIDYRFMDWFVSLGDTLNVRAYTEKDSTTSIQMLAYANATLNKAYNFRYELTFLLSDNLAE